VSYAALQDLDKGNAMFLDGTLNPWKRGWLALHDYGGAAIKGRYLNSDEGIVLGSALDLPRHRARIMTILIDPKVCSSPPHCMPKEVSPDLRKWKITYSTLKDLDRGRMKAYDGTLELLLNSRRLILKNAKGNQIGTKFCDKRDSFSIGAKINFEMHRVRVGTLVAGSTDILALVNHESSAETVSKTSVDQTNEDSMGFSSVHAALSLGLNFSHGINFAKDVKDKFGCSIHPFVRSGHFTLVVSFGRANFKMEEEYVSLALEASLAGFCGSLKVSQIADRVFSFCVSNKKVGFHITKMRSYSCPQFKCYFHL
jgi:hypothetical protein